MNRRSFFTKLTATALVAPSVIPASAEPIAVGEVLKSDTSAEGEFIHVSMAWASDTKKHAEKLCRDSANAMGVSRVKCVVHTTRKHPVWPCVCNLFGIVKK